VFERFHQDARRVVERARHEAAQAGQGQIGCEHLLLGLLAERAWPEPGVGCPPDLVQVNAHRRERFGVQRVRLLLARLGQPFPQRAEIQPGGRQRRCGQARLGEQAQQ